MGVKSVVFRGSVLFVIGVVFALVLNVLQAQSVVLSPAVLTNFFKSAWWVAPIFGTGSAAVGLLYPCLDVALGQELKGQREWSSVMRCVAVFVGINHATAKIDFASHGQLTLVLAAMSIGLWWLFDGSRAGLGVGVTIAVLATLATQLLVYHDLYRYSESDFNIVRSWLPCVFFSGGITMGNIGRQLATYDGDFQAALTRSKQE